MSKTILWKRTAQTLSVILVLSMLMVATVALAVIGQAPIKAGQGGTIIIDADTRLIIPAGALESNTHIRVKMVDNPNKTVFEFEPEGLQFNIPVCLHKSRASMNDADGYTLYFAPDKDNPDDYAETIYPEMGVENMKWSLNHFSIYYYRRR